MTKTTCIKNAAWTVVWDRDSNQHKYLRDGDVVFSGDTIDHVGGGYTGPVDATIDGRDLLVMPGLINIHCHPRSQPMGKGIIEELGNPNMYMSGLYDVKAVFWAQTLLPGDEGAPAASAETAYCELLLSGVTTVVDLSAPYSGWIDLLAKSGLRGVVGPWYAAADWYTENGHELKYRWDERAGRQRFEDAVRVIQLAEQHPCGRLTGILAPDTLDTCTVDLLRDSLDLARESGRKFTVHCAESMVEFHEFTRRFGKTPVQWAHQTGLLGDSTILGHVIFIDQHSWPKWWTRDDLRLLAEARVSVAHCPTPFARYGQTMESLGGYLKAGVNMGIGTDTFPHNLIEEMRLALTLARVAGRDVNCIKTADVFHAATVGGAQALGRDDIGRIAPGMKADLVLVDLRHPAMRPLRDPLRSLIYTAADRAVRDVYVDGQLVVDRGKVVTLDADSAAGPVEEAQRKAERGVRDVDWARRSAEQVSPLALDLA